jgi:DNA-binding FadR family transcriptional regulator
VSESTGSAALRALPRERLIDRATEAIKDFILANELKGGDRLPSEQELARSLGVSRNVVRQAISVLETIGVVRAAQGRGLYVADVADTDVFRQIAAWINPAELEDDHYYEVRSIFDRGIFELVIAHASDADLDRIEGIARAMAEGADDVALHRRHDEFHHACLVATGNPFLVTMGTILYRFFWNIAANGPRVRRVSSDGLRASHLEIARLLRRRRRADIPILVELHLGVRASLGLNGTAESPSEPDPARHSDRRSDAKPGRRHAAQS